MSDRLTTLLRRAGRDPASVRRSLMIGCFFGRTDAEVTRRIGSRNAADLRARGVVMGTPNEVREQLDRFASAGVQRIMLQWLDLDDLDGLEALARAVL